MIKCLELFSGTKSFTKEMEKRGFQCVTTDNQASLDPDILADVLVKKGEA